MHKKYSDLLSFIALFLVILFQLPSALADFPDFASSFPVQPLDENAWLTNFAILPRIPKPTEASNWTGYLKIQHPGCAPEVGEIERLTSEYGKASFHSDKSASKILDPIGKSLRDPTCASDAAAAYLVASVATFDRRNLLERENGYSDSMGGDPRFAEDEILIYLTIALLNRQKIRFLDPGSLGSAGVPYLGAYDCENSVIYVNPSLYPHDLAATLRHELDHFFRDKFWTGFTEAFSSKGKIDWKRLLLFDETLAVASSVFDEISQQRTPLWGGERLGGVLDEWLPARTKAPFATGNDFSLYSKKGPMNSLLSEMFKTGGYNEYPTDTFLASSFLRTDDMSSNIEKDVNHVTSAVGAAYFGDPGANYFSIPQTKNLHEYFPAGASPFSLWRNTYRDLNLPMMGRSPEDGYDSRYVLPWTADFAYGNPKPVLQFFPQKVLVAIDPVIDSGMGVSNACQAYLLALHSQDLDGTHYLGARIELNGVRGPRPSDKGIKGTLPPTLQLGVSDQRIISDTAKLGFVEIAPYQIPNAIKAPPSRAAGPDSVPVASKSDATRSARPCLNLSKQL